MRLIDAELLTINIALTAKNCARSNAQKALVGRILFMTDNMPTIEAEPNNGWISIEDRLPDNVKDVIVYDEFGWVYPAYYHTFNECWIYSFTAERCNHKITHWTPLPKPPKGK